MEDSEFEIVTEGKAKLITHKLEKYRVGGSYIPSLTPVFYNPLMKTNRDIMIVFLRTIKTTKNEFYFGESMGGIGVRSIRAKLEVDKELVCKINDKSKEAVELIKKNLELNGISEGVEVHCKDARVFNILHSEPGSRFDYLDLDPFGSPAMYIESAILSIKHEGHLGITATDTATLFGNNVDKAFVRYGVKLRKTQFLKELGVRALIASIAITASKQDIGIKPDFSYCERHYIRVYLSVLRGKKHAKESIKKLGFIVYDEENHSWKVLSSLDQLIKEKENKKRCSIIGPIWISSFIDNEIVERMNKKINDTSKEAKKIVERLREERSEIVGFYNTDIISKYLKVRPRKVSELISKINEVGYQANRTIFDPKGVKTNMPYAEFIKMYKELS